MCYISSIPACRIESDYAEVADGNQVDNVELQQNTAYCSKVQLQQNVSYITSTENDESVCSYTKPHACMFSFNKYTAKM